MSGRLRTYSPMARRSEKVAKAQPEFKAVYREVDQRSEGRCEWTDKPVLAETTCGCGKPPVHGTLDPVWQAVELMQARYEAGIWPRCSRA